MIERCVRRVGVATLALLAASALAGFERIEFAVPGPVVAIEAEPGAEGSGSLLILIRSTPPPPSDERSTDTPDPCTDETGTHESTLSLWHWGAAVDGDRSKIETLASGIRGETGRLLLTERRGADDPDRLLLVPGRLLRLTGSGAPPEVVLEDELLHPRTSDVVFTEDGIVVAIPGLGSTRYLRSTTDGSFATLAEIATPVEARLGSSGFRIDGSSPGRFGGGAGGLIWSTAPRAQGRHRLRGLRIEPTAEPATFEWWVRLPSHEELIEHERLTVGGTPAMFVTTRRADKLGIFGNKRIRIYRLQPDRSQTGHLPFFEVESKMNFWLPVAPNLLDVNADGHEDLVLAYWKGMTGARVVLDAYLGDGSGSFASSPRTTGSDVKRADRSFLSYGKDFDGDRRPDLLIVGKGELQLFRGTKADPRGKQIVSSRPDARMKIVPEYEADSEIDVQLGSNGMAIAGEALSGGPVRAVDLENDGRHEIVVLLPDGDGFKLGVIRYVAE